MPGLAVPSRLSPCHSPACCYHRLMKGYIAQKENSCWGGGHVPRILNESQCVFLASILMHR